MKFKTVIIYITGVFIDLSFSVVTQILAEKDDNWKFENESISGVILTWVILLSCQAGYIFASFIILLKNQENLEDEDFNETYGAMLVGLNTDNKNSIYIYPVFMLKRLMFTLIVLIFYNHPTFQLQALIILQFSHIVFIVKTKSCRQFR